MHLGVKIVHAAMGAPVSTLRCPPSRQEVSRRFAVQDDGSCDGPNISAFPVPVVVADNEGERPVRHCRGGDERDSFSMQTSGGSLVSPTVASSSPEWPLSPGSEAQLGRLAGPRDLPLSAVPTRVVAECHQATYGQEDDHYPEGTAR